jgi:hypothetical protein
MELLTQETFKEKVFNYDREKADAPVTYHGLIPSLVTFYAGGSYCDRMIEAASHLEGLYTAKIHFYCVDVNTPDGLTLAQDFGIAAVPTTILLPVGGEPMIVTGIILSDEQMEKVLLQLMSGLPMAAKKRPGSLII